MLTTAPQNVWGTAEFDAWLMKLAKMEAESRENIGQPLPTKNEWRLFANAMARGINEFIAPAGNA